jgi:hypothetical protein
MEIAAAKQPSRLAKAGRRGGNGGAGLRLPQEAETLLRLWRPGDLYRSRRKGLICCWGAKIKQPHCGRTRDAAPPLAPASALLAKRAGMGNDDHRARRFRDRLPPRADADRFCGQIGVGILQKKRIELLRMAIR